ncbi:predicted hydrolase [Longilinea arvoryzae]|uniref:Predicted hydrolase n=1 Tax=Longilinea arvoryzae TaxID=360412 RepID=A0A0S7B675_9CHLR|nr:alpha/beta hydrolase [Longilinea arvoryzae]GAP12623.1 predicted hydrolase [Longilinea arvoryzae]
MKSHFLAKFNANLRYHQFPGAGEPLVFIHGFGCASSCDYPRVAADPKLAGCNSILIDLLGSGFSDRPKDFGYTIDEHAKCILDLLGTLNFPAYNLYGHSMGGAIAIVAATLQPDLFRRLIVSEPNLDPRDATFSRAVVTQSKTEADYISNGHACQVDSATRSGNLIWAGSMAISAPHALYREALSLVQGSAPTWREQLLSLPMPRTFIVGEHSLPYPDAQMMSDAGLDVRIIPNAGHSMMWENPSGLAEAIRRARD